MAELISRLGIEWHVLLVQVVNFSILLFILQRFAYKPVMKMLDARRAQIEADVHRSEELADLRTTIEQEREEILAKARLQSEQMIKEGVMDAKEVGARIMADARAEAHRAIDAGHKQLVQERVKLVRDVKAEIGTIVAAAVEKVIAGAHDEKTEKRLVEEAVALINPHKESAPAHPHH